MIISHLFFLLFIFFQGNWECSCHIFTLLILFFGGFIKIERARLFSEVSKGSQQIPRDFKLT